MTVFADAFFYIALINRDDEYHQRALDFARTFRGRVVTTRWILMEVADALAASKVRFRVRAALREVESDPETQIIEASAEWFERGLNFYHDRADKDWSLTDCISFLAMQETGLHEALTGDHHFAQAGFSPIF